MRQPIVSEERAVAESCWGWQSACRRRSSTSSRAVHAGTTHSVAVSACPSAGRASTWYRGRSHLSLCLVGLAVTGIAQRAARRGVLVIGRAGDASASLFPLRRPVSPIAADGFEDGRDAGIALGLPLLQLARRCGLAAAIAFHRMQDAARFWMGSETTSRKRALNEVRALSLREVSER